MGWPGLWSAAAMELSNPQVHCQYAVQLHWHHIFCNQNNIFSNPVKLQIPICQKEAYFQPLEV